jgi:hypothetical protein
MHFHTLPILLVAALTFIVASAGLSVAPAAASNSIDWSDSSTRENVLVQDCHNPSVLSGFSPGLAFGLDFEITASYATDNKYHVFEDFTGINHPVIESRHVTFKGTAANSKSGRSLDYDGRLTRTSSYGQAEVTITDLVLHLTPTNSDEVYITVDRDKSGLIDNPVAVLLAYAPRGLHLSLCSFFAGLKVAG